MLQLERSTGLTVAMSPMDLCRDLLVVVVVVLVVVVVVLVLVVMLFFN